MGVKARRRVRGYRGCGEFSKGTTMRSLRTLAAAAVLAAFAGAAFAQATTPATPPASGPRAGMGPGMGMGPGWRAGPNNTPGWSMMTPEERAAHQQRMQGMTSHDDCSAYMNQHHQQMMARAAQRGASAPAQPRRDMCTGLP